MKHRRSKNNIRDPAELMKSDQHNSRYTGADKFRTSREPEQSSQNRNERANDAYMYETTH